MNIRQKLLNIQGDLKAPKNRTNTFGKYKYRSAEDILEAVKPHLVDNKLAQTISDEVFASGDRVYVKATVTLYDTESEETISTSAYAREEFDKKGMDSAQLTGSTSSYARKYALNGMYAIDDTQDADGYNGSPTKTDMTEKIEKVTEKEVLELIEIGKKKGQDEEALKLGALKYYRVNDLRKLPKKSLADLKEKIKKLPDVNIYEGTPFDK
ncbi:MAG: recombinase [Clostridia bacterium]|nr:recombinase [Clostridia bacterium]